MAPCLNQAYPNQLKQAFSAFNSKRVDMLIIDWIGSPRIAVEYQGWGHYQGNVEGRDRVKRKALQRGRNFPD